jgi:hypothetical protein
VAPRDVLGCPLDAADPTGVDPGGPAAQQSRDEQRGCGGERKALLDDRHGLELIGQGAGEQQDVAGEQLHRRFAVLDPAPRHAAAGLSGLRRLERDRIAGELSGRATGRVHRHPEGERRSEDLIEDDARAERGSQTLDDVRVLDRSARDE